MKTFTEFETDVRRKGAEAKRRAERRGRIARAAAGGAILCAAAVFGLWRIQTLKIGSLGTGGQSGVSQTETSQSSGARPETEVRLVEIADLSEKNGIPTDQALEKFYEDGERSYYFPSIRSRYIECRFSDGSTMPFTEALESGRAVLSDLNTYGIRYYVRDADGNFLEANSADAMAGGIRDALGMTSGDALPPGLQAVLLASGLPFRESDYSVYLQAGTETQYYRMEQLFGVLCSQAYTVVSSEEINRREWELFPEDAVFHTLRLEYDGSQQYVIFGGGRLFVADNEDMKEWTAGAFPKRMFCAVMSEKQEKALEAVYDRLQCIYNGPWTLDVVLAESLDRMDLPEDITVERLSDGATAELPHGVGEGAPTVEAICGAMREVNRIEIALQNPVTLYRGELIYGEKHVVYEVGDGWLRLNQTDFYFLKTGENGSLTELLERALEAGMLCG
mgnify:CR=1 FL=1